MTARTPARVVAVLAVAAAFLGATVAPENASAAYAYACPEPPGSMESTVDDAIETRNQRIADAEICVALVERLEAIDARLANLDDSAPGTAAQRVALSTKDRERLDLAWYGVWATVGLLLAILVGQKWYGAWRFLRE